MILKNKKYGIQKIEDVLGMVDSLVIQRFEKDKISYEHKLKDNVNSDVTSLVINQLCLTN